MRRKLWAKLLQWAQERCEHPPGIVSADILSGDIEGRGVYWCRACGAYRLWHEQEERGERSLHFGEWTTPHAAWWVR